MPSEGRAGKGIKYKQLARAREKGSDRTDGRGQSPIIYFLPRGGMHVGGWLILQVVSKCSDQDEEQHRTTTHRNTAFQKLSGSSWSTVRESLPGAEGGADAWPSPPQLLGLREGGGGSRAGQERRKGSILLLLLLEGWKAAMARLGLGSMSLLVARQALQLPRQLCWGLSLQQSCALGMPGASSNN